MFSMGLGSRECGGHVVIALRGELDLADAADVAAVLETVAALEPRIIVDLAGLEFIDARGVAALVLGRKLSRRAGGDLLLAAPRQRVLRVLTITRQADGLSVHASVEEAAASAAGCGGGRADAAEARQDAVAHCHAARNASLPGRSMVTGGWLR